MEAFSIEDLVVHVIKIGLDAYPPIVIPQERTKLSVLGEELSRRWPHLFDKIEASSTEFSISKTFGAEGDPRMKATVPTFVLIDRGPVFVMPILLGPPGGKVGDETEFMESFPEMLDTFRRAVGGRDFLRIGLVRELVFSSGKTSCESLLTQRDEFGGAKLVGGQRNFVYRDQLCNVRISLEPIQMALTTRLAVGQEVKQEPTHGVKIELDVNNHEFRALGETEMENVLARARSLWPEQMVEFLNTLMDRPE